MTRVTYLAILAAAPAVVAEPSLLAELPWYYGPLAILFTAIGAFPRVLERLLEGQFTRTKALTEMLFCVPIGIIVYGAAVHLAIQPAVMLPIAVLFGYLGRKALDSMAHLSQQRVESWLRGKPNDKD